MVILEEYDSDRSAIVNPRSRKSSESGRFPKAALSCFTFSTFRYLLKKTHAFSPRPYACTSMGRPVYKGKIGGTEIALYMTPVGAPAAAAVLEDIYALGAEKVILFGTCGVLDRSLPDGSVIIPRSAVRDEGTSYHYAPPADEIRVNGRYVRTFEHLLDRKGLNYTEGKVWTTDAVYRETRAKTERRRKQGCICVDMECAALASVAQFREKDLFQFFYAADNLDAEKWESRSLSPEKKKSLKEEIADAAADFAALAARL